MSSEFPKLQKHLDEIRTRIDQVLKDEFIEKELIEEVEFDFQTISFIPRSSRSDVVLALQNILSEFAKISPKSTKPSTLKIDKKHIFAAESLLRMSRCKDLAVRVLILGLESDVIEVAELASKALGEIKESLSDDDNSSYLETRPGSDAECRLIGKPPGCRIVVRT